MSNWRDNIQLASFRGKLFNVDLSTMKFGRRVTLNEYPFKDEPFAEDLGRLGRGCTFTAFIDDRTAGATDPLAAIMIEGDGVLPHPFESRVHHVQHLQKGHGRVDARGRVSGESPFRSRIRLSPDLER